MEFIAIAAVSAVAAVIMWEFFKHHVPFWRLRVEQMAQRDEEPKSFGWSVHPRTEYTVSRDGQTRTYSSLEEMPESDRKNFEDARKQIEEARKLAEKAFKNPFFDKSSVPGAFRQTTVTTKTSKTVRVPQPPRKPSRDLN